MNTWKKKFSKLFEIEKPVIGMVHLEPLPGSPGFDADGGMELIIEKALADAGALVKGGIDGIQIENQWDRPFLKPEKIGMETVASATAACTRIKMEYNIPAGVNIHLNGVNQSIAIAQASGCNWIRAFELANAYISNAGLVEAAGPDALRYRKQIDAEDILILGDFHVKHGSHQITTDRSLEEQAEDVETALADGLIITGLKSGSPPSVEDVKRIKGCVSIPLFIGSGFSYENAEILLPFLDGIIVGSALKKNGIIENSVDQERVSRFMSHIRELREKL